MVHWSSQPLAMVNEAACIGHRKRLRWKVTFEQEILAVFLTYRFAQ